MERNPNALESVIYPACDDPKYDTLETTISRSVAIVYPMGLSFSGISRVGESTIDQSNDMTIGAELLP